MLQDAGLALDEIVGILDAPTVADWKAIAARRLDLPDEEIHRLQLARTYLAGALLCRSDHPATHCKVMGSEIARPPDGQRSFPTPSLPPPRWAAASAVIPHPYD